MLQTLDHYHKVLKKNLKTVPDKFSFFLDSVKYLGYQNQNNHIHPMKSKNYGFLKLQPPKNKKGNTFLCWISHFLLKIFLQFTSCL